MKIPALIIIWIISGCILFVVTGCNRELDEYGGYYDEETQTYKYVNPQVKRNVDPAERVYQPRAGEIQSIKGSITRIDPDAKSVWLRIEDRKQYMILAGSLSSTHRDDKNKDIHITLSYVSPGGSVVSNAAFRQEWKQYVIQVLRNELVNQPVIAEISYLEQAKKFVGTIYKTVQTSQGSRVRNINLWMVQQGLSFYFIDDGQAPRHDAFRQAQQLARQKDLGLWEYQ